MNKMCNNNDLNKSKQIIEKLSIFTFIILLTIIITNVDVMASPVSVNGRLRIKGSQVVLFTTFF